MKAEFDVQNLRATLPNGDNPLEISLVGVSPTVFTRLALIGACSLLERRSDPVAAWAEIRAGNFSGRPKKPASRTIRALAALRGLPEAEADTLWRSLPKERRTAIRSHPDFRAALLTLQAQELPDAGQDLEALLQPAAEAGEEAAERPPRPRRRRVA